MEFVTLQMVVALVVIVVASYYLLLLVGTKHFDAFVYDKLNEHARRASRYKWKSNGITIMPDKPVFLLVVDSVGDVVVVVVSVSVVTADILQATFTWSAKCQHICVSL